jgi:hypothetical protein
MKNVFFYTKTKRFKNLAYTCTPRKGGGRIRRSLQRDIEKNSLTIDPFFSLKPNVHTKNGYVENHILMRNATTSQTCIYSQDPYIKQNPKHVVRTLAHFRKVERGLDRKPFLLLKFPPKLYDKGKPEKAWKAISDETNFSGCGAPSI